MKKSLLFALAVGAVAVLSSCDHNSGTTSTVSFNSQTFNLITTMDGSATPAVASSVYKFNFDEIAGTGTIAGEVSNSIQPISFATDPIKYKAYNYQWENAIHQVIDIETFKTKEIYNLDFQITTMAYQSPIVEGLPSTVFPVNRQYVVANYQYGDNVKVRTFWPDVTFRGNTTTTYPGAGGVEKSFSSSEVKYRVIINSSDKKATVILYDAKFAEEMPKPLTNVVLKDLPVTFTNAGYDINGTDITPLVYEGGVGTPNTDRIFNSFSLSVGGDLTEAAISYKVANVFNGSFYGSYIEKPQAYPDL